LDEGKVSNDVKGINTYFYLQYILSFIPFRVVIRRLFNELESLFIWNLTGIGNV